MKRATLNRHLFFRLLLNGVRRFTYFRRASLLWITAASIILLFKLTSSAAFAESRPFLAGINIAGAEFQSHQNPGIYGKHYIYTTPKQITYYFQRKMNTVRLPFRWERLQRSAFAEFDYDELQRIKHVVRFVTANSGWIILDPHNYGKYRGQFIGADQNLASAFINLWTRLAEEFKGDKRVIFGLMNEPGGIDADRWAILANTTISSIRASGAENLILVPGINHTGAHSWSSQRLGTSNATAMQSVIDPLNNMAFEVHQYFDSNSSGTSDHCVSDTIGVERLVGFTKWAKDRKVRAFLGEFGAAPSETCLKALANTLAYMQENSDVWIGWAYWAGGAWWKNYPFSVEPENGNDKPQMDFLIRFAVPPARSR